jgi:fermentation-respiration switch protein FrsA (DUF1100 family)
MIWLVSQETALVFQAPRVLGDLRPAAPFEQVTIPRADGLRQIAWVMRTASQPDAHAWVIYLHGNDATIASRLNILHAERLRALGLNVLAPEYRGFAGVDGTPSEAAVDTDGRAAYDYLRTVLHVPAQRIVIYGWSLGSAVAVDLASHVEQGAVILEGAPASVVAIGQQRYPYFPVRLLIRNPFDSIRRIGAIDSAILFLHSPDDAVIPIAEGRRLYKAAPEPKRFIEVSGGHVYASERDPKFFPAIGQFLHELSLVGTQDSNR